MKNKRLKRPIKPIEPVKPVKAFTQRYTLHLLDNKTLSFHKEGELKNRFYLQSIFNEAHTKFIVDFVKDKNITSFGLDGWGYWHVDVAIEKPDEEWKLEVEAYKLKKAEYDRALALYKDEVAKYKEEKEAREAIQKQEALINKRNRLLLQLNELETKIS